MRTRKLVLVLLCVVLVGAVVPATAGAAFSNYKSASADAWWTSWNWDIGVEPGPNDAVEERGISGWNSSSIWKDGKVATEIMKDSGGSVWMTSYTPATATGPRTWKQFNVFSMSPTFVIGKQLSSATLDFMAPGEIQIWRGAEPWVQTGVDVWTIRDADEVIDAGMVSVKGTWKPSGALTRSTFFNKQRSADFTYSDRSQQNYRDANANVSVVGANGTVYWFQTIAGSIYDSKGISRFPAGF